jgi:hypothetical protein
MKPIAVPIMAESITWRFSPTRKMSFAVKKTATVPVMEPDVNGEEPRPSRTESDPRALVHFTKRRKTRLTLP